MVSMIPMLGMGNMFVPPDLDLIVRFTTTLPSKIIPYRCYGRMAAASWSWNNVLPSGNIRSQTFSFMHHTRVDGPWLSLYNSGE
jgi:hypothetical protein